MYIYIYMCVCVLKFNPTPPPTGLEHLAKQYFGLPHSKRLRVIIADALRLQVKETSFSVKTTIISKSASTS